MSRQRSPAFLRALDLLVDGEWHGRDRVVVEMSRMIPPGRGMRQVEYERIRQAKRYGPAGTARVIQRDPDLLVASGQRSIALDVLHSAKVTFEQRTDEAGKKWVRLRGGRRETNDQEEA